MTKLEFMKELESLLLDIPLEEREEALQYYNGYFDDAGEDHEEEIIKELVSPGRVANLIKTDLNTDETERENMGYFTDKGFQNTLHNEYEIDKSTGSKQQNSNQRSQSDQSNQSNQRSTGQSSYENSKRSNNTNSGLILLIAIFTFPIWLPVMLSVLGILIGIIAAVLGVVFGFGAAGIAMTIAGIILFIAGLIKLSIPLIGLVLIGGGMVLFGLGMLFVLASVILCRKVLPVLVNGFVNICRLPFRNRRVMA